MDEKKIILYKAALLHDIGKFWQRTRNKETYKAHGEGRGQKTHPLLSEAFVEEWLKDDLIADIVAFHHQDDLNRSDLKGEARALAALVCIADRLASGEREEDDKPYPRYFQAIFSQICLPANPHRASSCEDPDKPRFKQDICSLNKLDYQFPFADKNSGSTMKDGYRSQWENMRRDAPHIISAHPDTLFYLSKKHLWAVPSAYYFSKPDISLHEHSRLAAAIAVCLYDYIGSRTDTQRLEEWTLQYVQSFQSQKSFRLLCAELSGIQKYIYNIAHSGAMRALKGRSFWLQQIVDSVADYILTQFDLPLSNLIFAGGGKLIVLLPNTGRIKEEMPKIQAGIEKKILGEYDGNISLVFGDIELMGDDFFGKRISGKWDELYKTVEKNKVRKMAAGGFPADFFQPQNLWGAILQCKATKREICPKQEEPNGEKKNIGKPAFIKRTFFAGQQQVNAYQITDKETQQPSRDEYICEEQFNAQQIGYKIRKDCLGIVKNSTGSFQVLDDLDRIDFYRSDTRLDAPKSLLLFNDDEFLQHLPGQPIAKGWKFYGGDWVPLDETGETREFGEIISDATGIDRLGVLRMDVDNLGEIFKQGLGDNATFSRIVQLSSMLDFFFSGYLNILKDMYWTAGQGIVKADALTEPEKSAVADREDKSAVPLRDILQIVYAGGDDLFIVSVWNVLPDLAWWIHERFTEFTCQNPCFSLSAGIALFDNKYPVYKAAKYAGLALDEAKGKWTDKQGTEREKGRISFLGKAMSWKDFDAIRKLSRSLYRWCKEEKTNRALIGRLGAIYGEYEVAKAQQKRGSQAFRDTNWSQWRWRAAYSLVRYGEQNKTLKNELTYIATDLFTDLPTDSTYIEVLGTGVQWADFLTRTKK